MAVALELAGPILDLVAQSFANYLQIQEYRPAILSPVTHLGVELRAARLVPACVEDNALCTSPNHLSHVPSNLQRAQVVASWACVATPNGLVKIVAQYLIMASSRRVNKNGAEKV